MAVSDITREMEDLYRIGLKTLFTKKKRLNVELDKIAFAALPRGWVTGCPGYICDHEEKQTEFPRYKLT